MASSTLPDRVFAQQLREAIAHSAAVLGLPAHQAEEVAERSLETLRQVLGGKRVYLANPKGSNGPKCQRAAELQARGLSMRDVAARLNVTVDHAYRLCAQARRQGFIPADGAGWKQRRGCASPNSKPA